MTRLMRVFAAGFDTLAMAGVAVYETSGRFVRDGADYVLWGAVVAAAICTLVILSDASPVVAWAAIGYPLFGGLLTRGSPHWGLVLLAVALMPLVPRPQRSLLLGLGIAVVAAIASQVLVTLLV